MIPGNLKRACIEDEGHDRELLQILPGIPARWHRMDLLSRAVILEIGIRRAELEDSFPVRETGIIGGTVFGSVKTDFQFWSGMEAGQEFPSPHLFTYTLPNMALSEASSCFDIRGPVYAVTDTDPRSAAMSEAKKLLRHDKGLKAVFAGVMEFGAEDELPYVDFEIITGRDR